MTFTKEECVVATGAYRDQERAQQQGFAKKFGEGTPKIIFCQQKFSTLSQAISNLTIVFISAKKNSTNVSALRKTFFELQLKAQK